MYRYRYQINGKYGLNRCTGKVVEGPPILEIYSKSSRHSQFSDGTGMVRYKNTGSKTRVFVRFSGGTKNSGASVRLYQLELQPLEHG